jgi:hypothetical protein
MMLGPKSAVNLNEAFQLTPLFNGHAPAPSWPFHFATPSTHIVRYQRANGGESKHALNLPPLPRRPQRCSKQTLTCHSNRHNHTRQCQFLLQNSARSTHTSAKNPQKRVGRQYCHSQMFSHLCQPNPTLHQQLLQGASGWQPLQETPSASHPHGKPIKTSVGEHTKGGGLPLAGHTQRNQANPIAGGRRQSLTSEIRLTTLL